MKSLAEICLELTVLFVCCAIFYLAFNYGVSTAFGWPKITFFQAVCIVVCSYILQKK